jgi:3'(2'), 5'-bisphosphate nucleotidase
MPAPHPPSSLGREAGVAVDIVAEAMRLLRAVERTVHDGLLAKADASPVTLGDFAVQALVAVRLAAACPGDLFVAEEDAAELRREAGREVLSRVVQLVRPFDATADDGRVLDWIDRGGALPGRRFWTLDPIDGTKGLLRGGQYAVALALIADGVVRLAVLGCPRWSPGARPDARQRSPADGGIAVAVRSGGAWWLSASGGDPHRLRVSEAADPTRLRALRSYEGRHADVGRFDRTLRALDCVVPPLLVDSQVKHAVLASGGADLLLRCPPRPDIRDAIWDQAAGSLLIEEAGGTVTDLLGRRLDFSTGRYLTRNEGVVGTNGRLHEACLAALRVSAGET